MATRESREEAEAAPVTSVSVTVAKVPDGDTYMTKDSHGDLWSGAVGAEVVNAGPDSTVNLVETERGTFVWFSWVDYMDTATKGVPGDGVRHTVELPLAGSFAVGPYTITIA